MDPLLSPSTIAVIGASATEGKVGHEIFKNLTTQGFSGKVFPVNPKGGEILGKQVFANVKDISENIDLAVIVIPAAACPEALRECAEKKIPAAVVISAGFSEVHTDEGKKLEEELIAIAHASGMTLLGPNCLGMLRTKTKMNASFAKALPPKGTIGFISQSGATAVALMDAAVQNGLGFSAVLSIGNKALVDETAALQLLAKDPETKVIGFYLESIHDGRKFLEAVQRVTLNKPVVILKAGTSDVGKRAASSHTGALAGLDAGVDALCAQSSAVRAHTSDEFLELLSALSQEPRLPTSRIAIITNAGGPGILAADAAAAEHLELPSLEVKNLATLKEKLTATASTGNPIDLVGDAGADRYEAALLACREDPNIDGICVLLTPQVMTPCGEIAEMIVRITKTAPLMPVTTCFMGGESVEESRKILRKNLIPTFETPEAAVRALGALRNTKIQIANGKIPLIAHSSYLKALPKGLLDERTTADLFSQYGIPLPKAAVAKTAEEAVQIAKKIGFPVILKISSPDILHKTDVGGLASNLKTEADVKSAFQKIQKDVGINMPKAQIRGILVQQFLPVGNEFIVGCVRDPSFGPLVMVGLGGIYTELFRDTAFRIAPITEEDAYLMLQELKSWKLLLGMRGKKQSDIDSLVKLIVSVSNLVSGCSEIKELDLNPVLVAEKQIIVADAKVIIG